MFTKVFDEPSFIGTKPVTDYFLCGMFLTDIIELVLLILLFGGILMVDYLASLWTSLGIGLNDYCKACC